MTLMNESVPAGGGFGFGFQNAQVGVRPGRIVVVANNRIFLVRTPELDRKQFPEPVHAKALPATHVLGGQDLNVPLANFIDTKGAQSVSMRKEERGVEVSEDKQHLVLNARAVRDHAGELVLRFLGADGEAPGRPAGRAPDARLDEYLKTAGPRFEKLTGRKPDGIPVWLPLNFTVQNKDLQSIDVTFGVFVEVPEAPVRAKLKQTVKSPRTVPGRTTTPSDARVAELIQKQAALEKRIAELEGKLDQANRKLDLLAELLKGKK
jgi:hypothetical protein